MSKSVHDKIAENLSKKFSAPYKKQKGIDIVTRERVIEVETKKNGIAQGIQQVQKSPKARYLAVNQANVKNALKATQGTGIGVMGPTGKIIKRAGRKKKKS